MARTKPLTNTEVKQAKGKDKVYKLSDGNGLQLRVMPNGSKSWLLDYIKPVVKKRSTIGLGSYPETGLADARAKREKFRNLVAQGIDPKTYKEERALEVKAEMLSTLELVSKEWFEVKKTKIKPDTAQDAWRSLEIHIFPSLGKKPISQITAPLTIEVLKPLAQKGTLETVKRLTQRLNEIMVYAVNTGLIYSNPLSGIKSAFKSPTQNPLPTITQAELPEFLEALNYASIKVTTRLLIEWQLHTMTRPNEASGARWDEIDLITNVWTIPAERMKKGLQHKVPLVPETLKILARLKAISGHKEYLFPADRNPKTHMNSQTANMAIKRMGYQGKLVAHGLRSLASTILNEHGHNADLIESALAHTDKNEVRRAYNRTDYLERRRELMCWWSTYLIGMKA
ncbi:integrase domain-containing protein [Psychrosphaera sp.]|nr:integrase domain-containing protein [Psychrosphaera sp.]